MTNHVRLALSGGNEFSRQLLWELLSFSTHHAVTLEGTVDLRWPLDEIKKGCRSGHRRSIRPPVARADFRTGRFREV